MEWLSSNSFSDKRTLWNYSYENKLLHVKSIKLNITEFKKILLNYCYLNYPTHTHSIPYIISKFTPQM